MGYSKQEIGEGDKGAAKIKKEEGMKSEEGKNREAD